MAPQRVRSAPAQRVRSTSARRRGASRAVALLCTGVCAALAAGVAPAASAPAAAPDSARTARGGAGRTAAPGAEAGRPGVRYAWPLDPRPKVTREFDKPAHPYGPGHRGVDLGASPGETVAAAGPGVVAFAGAVAGRGVVSIDHPSGLRTTYEPVVPAVAAGDVVRTGTVIGRVAAGHPGCPRAACLHWGLRDGQEYLDPRSLLDTVTIRLLPV